MPILDLGADYVDGQTATADIFNDKFDAIKTLLNVTGLDSDNIQDGGITAADLAVELQAALPSTILTSLPSSPTDGQEILYASSLMATAGILWRFRYNSSLSSYKWQFIGGAPWCSSDTASTNHTGTGAYVSITGCQVTAPLAGVYVTRWGASMVASPGTDDASTPMGWLSHTVGGTAASDTHAIFYNRDPTNWSNDTPSRTMREVFTSASSLILALKYHSGFGVTTRDRYIEIIPERVG